MPRGSVIACTRPVSSNSPDARGGGGRSRLEFEKAGKPGWGAIVPIYNIVILLEIAGKPIWWFILFFIPFVNFIVVILISIEVAKNFGKGTGFGLGLAFLGFIFYPILGFGDAKYQGRAAA